MRRRTFSFRPLRAFTTTAGAGLVLVLAAGAACSRKPASDDDASDAGGFDAAFLDVAIEEASVDARAEAERAAWGDAGRFCGDGQLQPDCPLQGWMKKNATTMIGFGDISAIADVFDRMVPLVPDEVGIDGRPIYGNWRSIAEDGAAAARAGDIAAAKAACRGCHVQYLIRYRATIRGRPIPAAAAAAPRDAAP